MSQFDVQALQKAANSSPYFKATMELFAKRQRRRSTLTVNALKMRLKDKGYKVTYKESAAILKTLAENGVGKLQEDALTDIGARFDRLGKAVLAAPAEAAPIKKQEMAKIEPQTPLQYRLSLDIPADKLNAVLDQISRVLNKGG